MQHSSPHCWQLWTRCGSGWRKTAGLEALQAGCRSDVGAVRPLPRSGAPTSSMQLGSSEQADARCDPLAAQQADYIALAAVKGTVHPKFCSAGGSTAGVMP